MRIAVWNMPPADLFVSGLRSGQFNDQFEVLRTEIGECERLLRSGEVDIALLPTTSILRNSSDFDVFPAVALSSWRYPFARLGIDHGLDEPVEQIAYDPQFDQEKFLASLVLREHYGMEPSFVAFPDAAVDELLEVDADARLLVGPDVPTVSGGALTLDIGQEWYELAQYPMVWGLIAALRDQISPTLIRAVRDGIRASEEQRAVWMRAHETSADLHAFYGDDLRLRLDNLAVASLTELRQYFFFFERRDEVPEIPFVFLPDEDGDEDAML
jgi:predicted solute-binding protein